MGEQIKKGDTVKVVDTGLVISIEDDMVEIDVEGTGARWELVANLEKIKPRIPQVVEPALEPQMVRCPKWRECKDCSKQSIDHTKPHTLSKWCYQTDGCPACAVIAKEPVHKAPSDMTELEGQLFNSEPAAPIENPRIKGSFTMNGKGQPILVFDEVAAYEAREKYVEKTGHEPDAIYVEVSDGDLKFCGIPIKFAAARHLPTVEEISHILHENICVDCVEIDICESHRKKREDCQRLIDIAAAIRSLFTGEKE